MSEDESFRVSRALVASIGLLLVFAGVAAGLVSGALLDDSGNGFHLTEQGTLTEEVASVDRFGLGIGGFGGAFANRSTADALALNSSQTYIVALNVTVTDADVDVYYQVASDDPGRTLIELNTNPSRDSMRISLFACDGSKSEIDTGDGLIGDGFHVVAFRFTNESTNKLLVKWDNGTQSRTSTGTADPCNPNGAELHVGRDRGNSNPATNLELFEVRAFDSALSNQTIDELITWSDDTFANRAQGTEKALYLFGDDLGTAPTPPGPSPVDFADGIEDFASGLGFQSADSQFFFTLALVGIATVTTTAGSKWVKSGQTKNWIIAGAGLLTAVFAVYVRFIELWMFVLAATLGVFAIVGDAKTIQNTWTEIRDEFKDAVTATEEVPEPPPQQPPRQGPPPGGEMRRPEKELPETAALEDDVVFEQVDADIDVAGTPAEPVEPSGFADDVEPVEGAGQAVEAPPPEPVDEEEG